jgi:hypothetical protein
MTPEVAQAMMKEWYWPVIVLAIVMMAFAPSFLKGRCPSCKKRALRSVDVDDKVLSELNAADAQNFTMFYRCDNCQSRFKRVRSGPLEDAADPRFERVFVDVRQQSV